MAELDVGELVEVGLEQRRVIDDGHHQHDLAERMGGAAGEYLAAAEAIGDRNRKARRIAIGERAAGTATIADGSCNPNMSSVDSLGKTHTVDPNDFTALPTGGTSLIEGSIEYRFPVLMKNLQGAIFLDAGYVGAGSSDATQGKAAVTPGFGVRYLSPVGPIRVDLGFRPSLTDHLTVITETVQPDGMHRLVQLATQREYNPVAGGRGISKVLNRLALHLSIGQAF